MIYMLYIIVFALSLSLCYPLGDECSGSPSDWSLPRLSDWRGVSLVPDHHVVQIEPSWLLTARMSHSADLVAHRIRIFRSQYPLIMKLLILYMKCILTMTACAEASTSKCRSFKIVFA